MDKMDKFFMVALALMGLSVMWILYDATIKMEAVSCLAHG